MQELNIQPKTEINTYLGLRDEYGKIINEQILIISRSGFGKSLSAEGLIEKFHKNGYLVLIIGDPKREIEFGFQMFEPEERYHLDHLRKIGRKPMAQKVKLYHPFTFNIPNYPLPDINFYTLSLKELGRYEWGLLAETGWDKDTMRLLLNASQNISKEEGIYGFIHYINSLIEGKHEGKRSVSDPKNWYLKSGTGSMKSMSEISNYIHPFKKDYFLCKDSSPLKINWKSIVNDREHYHVFTSKWINDEKLRDFNLLAILNGLYEHKDLLKYPVAIYMPEIRKQCPDRPTGHKVFLSIAIKEMLSLMRSSGRGMSSVLDSQSWVDIDTDVKNSATTTFFGEIGGGDDMEKIAKAYNYKRDIRDQLKKMDYKNSFLMLKHEEFGGFTLFFPSGCHAEPHYNFIEKYKETFPEKMKRYSDLVAQMESMLKEEESKFKEKAKRIEREHKERQMKLDEERKAKQENKAQEKQGKSKEKDLEGKKKIMKIAYELYHDENVPIVERSFRKIAKKLEINHITAKNYIMEYGKLLNPQTEDQEEIEPQENPEVLDNNS